MEGKLTGWLIGGRGLLKQVEVKVEDGHALCGMREQLGITGNVTHIADLVKEGEDVWCADDAYDVFPAADRNGGNYPIIRFEDESGNVLASVFGFALLLGYSPDGDTCGSTVTFEELDELLKSGQIKAYDVPKQVMREYLP